MTEVKWATAVTTNNRSLDSESSVFTKQLSKLVLVRKGKEVNILESNDVLSDEERVALACAALGVASGPRYKNNAGLVITASANATDNLKPGGKFYTDEVIIEWESDAQLNMVFNVGLLMDMSFALSSTLLSSAEKFNYSESTKKEVVKAKPKTDVNIDDYITIE